MTSDAKEALRTFVTSDEYPHVVELLRALSADQERLVLQLSMDAADDRQLVHRKLRAEGAKKLLTDFTAQLQSLRLKQKV